MAIIDFSCLIRGLAMVCTRNLVLAFGGKYLFWGFGEEQGHYRVLRKGWEGQRQVKAPKCTPSALSEEDAADRGLPDSNL